MAYLYKNWAFMCLALAVMTTVILVSSISQLGMVVFLIWLQFPVYLLHQFEEHAYPGGFKSFVNREVFGNTESDFPLNDMNIFWINIPFIWVMFPCVACLAQNINLSIGAILPYFGLFNATLHILAFMIKRKYNPGLGVSVLLNYPTGFYTLYILSEHGLMNMSIHLGSFFVALIGHLDIVAHVRSYKSRT